uniref:Ribosomal protein S10 n=1 Tax=Utricularia reniformis TaxID=192314 RepID=A0A1Y0B1C7_9LAMI|nr:ribosomal protein S10 [Utricularia reniformis]ART31256.1 ribosomal protein S10 [Utricularia reniformis]
MRRQESTTKIGIVMQYVNHPFLENDFWGLPPYTRQIGLPSSRVNYTVLRSPHIDQKSREQFEMKMKREFFVIKTETHELRKNVYLELNIQFYFLARPVRIRENSRDCFEVRSDPCAFPEPG